MRANRGFPGCGTWIGLVAALCLLGATHPAGAQTAEEHYKAGAKAFEEADFPLAVTELEAATRMAPTAKAWLLLGNAYTKVGHFDDARKAFEAYLKLEPSSAKSKKIKQLISDLDVFRTTKFNIKTTPPGATVYLDLKAAGAQGKTPQVLSVKPGQYRIILELEGYETARVPDALVAAGQEVPIEVTLKVKGCDLQLAVEPAGTSLMLDGNQAAPTPAEVRVAHGEHRLVFTGKDLVSRTETIQCTEDKPMQLAVKLEPVPPPPPPPKPVVVEKPKPKPVVFDPKVGRRDRITGLALGGAGLLLIGGGAALTVLGLQAGDRFSNPLDGDIFDPDLEMRAKWLPSLGVGLAVAGAAVVAGGAFLYFRGVKARRDQLQVTVLPWLGPSGAGLTASGSF